MKRSAGLLMLIAGAVPGCGQRERQPAADRGAAATDAGQPAIRLVLLVVVDQLASWQFERDEPYLRGGLARIIREGRYWPAARYPFAASYTAPGHAALVTGAPPAVTRILGNGWHRRETGADRSAVDDPDSPTLVIGGPAAEPLGGTSGAQLAVDGVADVLRRARGGRARSIAIGLKDRGAVFAAGKRPDLAIWYEPALAALTTSRYYAAEPPAWLAALHTEHPIAARFTGEWTPLDAALLAEVTGNPDAAPGEGGSDGLDATFPHGLAGLPPAQAAEAVGYGPAGTEIMLDAARAAITAERLGADDDADLLVLTFSGHDYAGHIWGQESWERLDLILRLDRSLAGFLDDLDRDVGRGRWALVLASDHGATRMVDQQRAAGKPAFRVRNSQLVTTAEATAARLLPGKRGPWVAAYNSSTVYLTPAFAALPARDRERALDAMVAALAKIPGIGWVARTDRLAGDCAGRTGRELAACLSLVPELSGEIYVQPAPGSLITSDKYPTGTSHGSGNPDDVTVPLALLVPDLSPRRSPEAVSPLRVAATLAKLLGIPAPPAATDPPLY